MHSENFKTVSCKEEKLYIDENDSAGRYTKILTIRYVSIF